MYSGISHLHTKRVHQCYAYVLKTPEIKDTLAEHLSICQVQSERYTTGHFQTGLKLCKKDFVHQNYHVISNGPKTIISLAKNVSKSIRPPRQFTENFQIQGFQRQLGRKFQNSRISRTFRHQMCAFQGRISFSLKFKDF